MRLIQKKSWGILGRHKTVENNLSSGAEQKPEDRFDYRYGDNENNNNTESVVDAKPQASGAPLSPNSQKPLQKITDTAIVEHGAVDLNIAGEMQDSNQSKPNTSAEPIVPKNQVKPKDQHSFEEGLNMSSEQTLAPYLNPRSQSDEIKKRLQGQITTTDNQEDVFDEDAVEDIPFDEFGNDTDNPLNVHVSDAYMDNDNAEEEPEYNRLYRGEDNEGHNRDASILSALNTLNDENPTPIPSALKTFKLRASLRERIQESLSTNSFNKFVDKRQFQSSPASSRSTKSTKGTAERAKEKAVELQTGLNTTLSRKAIKDAKKTLEQKAAKIRASQSMVAAFKSSSNAHSHPLMKDFVAYWNEISKRINLYGVYKAVGQEELYDIKQMLIELLGELQSQKRQLVALDKKLKLRMQSTTYSDPQQKEQKDKIDAEYKEFLKEADENKAICSALIHVMQRLGVLTSLIEQNNSIIQEEARNPSPYHNTQSGLPELIDEEGNDITFYNNNLDAHTKYPEINPNNQGLNFHPNLLLEKEIYQNWFDMIMILKRAGDKYDQLVLDIQPPDEYFNIDMELLPANMDRESAILLATELGFFPPSQSTNIQINPDLLISNPTANGAWGSEDNTDEDYDIDYDIDYDE